VTGFGDVIGCVVDITQRSGSLYVVGQCRTADAVELAGTVDPATGRVAVVGHGGPCSTITVDGTAAADGQSIGGTVSCMVGSASFGGVFTASHCGNGILDPGEECDDGNVFDGDCCSSACLFEASGSACPDDDSPCTTDVCDGRGHCQHPANPAAAGTPCGALCDQCGTSRCDAAGTCLRDSKPDGSPCNDDDACTTGDTCSRGSASVDRRLHVPLARCVIRRPGASPPACRDAGYRNRPGRSRARALAARVQVFGLAPWASSGLLLPCVSSRGDAASLPARLPAPGRSLHHPAPPPFIEGSDDNGMFHAVLCPHRRSRGAAAAA